AIYDRAKKTGAKFDFESVAPSPRKLMLLAAAVPAKESEPRERLGACGRFFANIGGGVIGKFSETKSTIGFLGDTVLAMLRVFSFRGRFRRCDLLLQVQKAGPEALPIVGLISFLVGLILAFVGSVQLAKYGSEIYIADLVALAMAREMGAIMVGIVMSGRTGAAFAAELGSMKVNEEISAYETFGISPMDFLVVPRILALVAMFPLLTIFADLIGIVGGFVIGWGLFGINYEVYMARTAASLTVTQCMTGVGKSLIFGIVVAMIGCMRGMRCEGSSESVGQGATSSVVESITTIIVVDAIFAVIFTIYDI
ncbi:MAG: ABC transporter permease, partial [Opitutales bacterium]|nr:ABC transporter permease [Opitutales bacterium]